MSTVSNSCFPQMVERIPEGRIGEAEVEHFEISKPDVAMAALRRDRLTPGRFARLRVNGVMVMTDTLMERVSNIDVVRQASGDVLIAGLGLGMILDPILAKDEVRSVLVVEQSADVVRMIGPHFEHENLTIQVADIFEWRPEKGQLFDVIYFDIWPDKCTDNLKEMATLHRRFARRLDRSNPNCWMMSWSRDDLRAARHWSR